MSKIIFRKLFVKREDKLEGEIHISSAKTWARISADMLTSKNGEIDVEYLDAVEKMLIHMDKASECLGFKNVDDMLDYKNIHGAY